MTAALNPMPAADLAKASLDRLDAVASVMERKWGIDRLPKLVDAPLAVRFRRQAERLDEAIRIGVSAAVSAQAEAMLRAWHALDAAAITGGWKPLAPTIWEAVLPETGEVIAIVRDSDEAFALAKERKGAVWTLAEVAIAIEAFGDTVRETKPARKLPARNRRSRSAGFAGLYAPLLDPRPEIPSTKPQSSKSDFDWERGDDIPF